VKKLDEDSNLKPLDGNSEKKKPFWLEPPYVYLLNVIKSHKLDPWKIDLAGLILSFLELLAEEEEVDFTVSGQILHSASVIHRKKTDSLLKETLIQTEEKVKSEEDLSKELKANIDLLTSLRRSKREASLSELAYALKKIIMQKQRAKRKDKKSFKEASREEFKKIAIDEYKTDFEKIIFDTYEYVKRYLANGLSIELSWLIRKILDENFSQDLGHDRKVIMLVNIVLSLLFLASDQKITIEHDEDNGQIVITSASF